MPARCNWIIRNEDLKYKVSTDYMDAYYRKEKMYEMLPMISLNHSQFVLNENVQTAEGLATLKDFNSRKTYHNQYKAKYNYKHTTHHKKKWIIVKSYLIIIWKPLKISLSHPHIELPEGPARPSMFPTPSSSPSMAIQLCFGLSIHLIKVWSSTMYPMWQQQDSVMMGD